MKPFVKPLLLGTLILILAGIAYWDEKQTASEKVVAENKNRLIDFKPEAIESVDLIKSGQAPIAMEKIEGRWQLQKPLAYPADSEGIDRLLKTLSEIQFEKDYDSSEARLKDFGLDNPVARVRLKDKSKKVWDIQIGAKSPVGYSSYLRINDLNKVYLVSHYVFTATNKDFFEFRDKSLQIPEESTIKAISYQWKSEPELRLSKSQDVWTIDSEPKQKADTSAVKSFLNGLNRQKIEGFLDAPAPALLDALTQTGKGSEQLLKVTLTREGAPDFVVRFLENNGKIYTQLPIGDSFAEIDASAKESLLKTARDFIDLNMFSYATGDVKTLQVDGRSYVRDEDSWVSENDRKENPNASRLLLTLEFAKADELLTPEAAEKVMPGPPLHTLLINGSVPVEIWKNPQNNASVYVRVGKERSYVAQADLFAALKDLTAPAVEKEKVLGGKTKSKS